MASPELSPLPAAMASCTRPTVRPASQMARVVDSVEGVRNVHVVYSESYHAAVFDKPRSLRDASEFCAQIGGRDNRAFRFCDRNALAWQEDARRMRLLVVAQGCAFFDRGKRWKGGTYDGRQYIVAAHAGAWKLRAASAQAESPGTPMTLPTQASYCRRSAVCTL